MKCRGIWCLPLSVVGFLVAALPVAASENTPFSGSSAQIERTAEPQRMSLHARQRARTRRAAELRRETSRRLRQEALTEGAPHLAAVEDLIDLYVQLRLDTTLADYERQQLAGKVRSRLLRVHEDLVQDQKAAPLNTSSASSSRDSQSEGRLHHDHSTLTAQLPGGTLAGLAVDRALQQVAEFSHAILAQQGIGGPGAAAGGMFGGLPPFPGDYGDQLADLIQTVIAPSTWERNGGPGSIYYYRPLRVLVIRQTGEVHARVGNVVRDLRRAGN